MTKDDICFIQDALRYLLGYFNAKIRYGIYNSIRCETKEMCQELCNELSRLIDLLEKETRR